MGIASCGVNALGHRCRRRSEGLAATVNKWVSLEWRGAYPALVEPGGCVSAPVSLTPGHLLRWQQPSSWHLSNQICLLDSDQVRRLTAASPALCGDSTMKVRIGLSRCLRGWWLVRASMDGGRVRRCSDHFTIGCLTLVGWFCGVLCLGYTVAHAKPSQATVRPGAFQMPLPGPMG